MSHLAGPSTSGLPVQSPSPSPAHTKPTIIGLYGVPGCGKSYLLAELKKLLKGKMFKFYEGSEVISSLLTGGLDAFRRLEEQEKVQQRQRAIDSIEKDCASAVQTGVVTGHFMFWNEGDEIGHTVYTQNDLNKYTHILYLDIDPKTVLRRRSEDTERSRSSVSAEHLRRWQEAEKTQLRQLCRDNGIMFLSVPETLGLGLASCVMNLLMAIPLHSENNNLDQAEEKLDEILVNDNRQLHTMLVLDADKTLTSGDTGNLFWELASKRRPGVTDNATLKELFSSRLGYSHVAFRQAAFLYQEAHGKLGDDGFGQICEEVASATTLHPEFVSLLRLVSKRQDVGAVVVTCGLSRIWEKILEREGLSGSIKVIGGGYTATDFIVTPEVKASLVLHLQTTHKLFVWAFGDSPLDLPMLSQADEAIVVVGEEESRSKSMEAALSRALVSGGLQARQFLVPNNVSPRLDTSRLPLVGLSKPEHIHSVIFDSSYIVNPGLRLVHATDKESAKLLATPMRYADIVGPAFRKAHENAGWYLATEFLAKVVGVEVCTIPHVQGGMTFGYRLRYEQKTLIVPLMRGGEPMALGVNLAFPLARFLHAKNPSDITIPHLRGIRNVILVDSVINSGKSIIEFAKHVRELRPLARIVAVAGVVQDRSVSEGGLARQYGDHAGLDLVALRISNNKYTGSGGTDTGNRLFNTTHLV